MNLPLCTFYIIVSHRHGHGHDPLRKLNVARKHRGPMCTLVHARIIGDNLDRRRERHRVVVVDDDDARRRLIDNLRGVCDAVGVRAILAAMPTL